MDVKGENVKSKAANEDMIKLLEEARNRLLQKNQPEEEGKATLNQSALSEFVRGLPYGADTAFGYTTLIDPK